MQQTRKGDGMVNVFVFIASLVSAGYLIDYFVRPDKYEAKFSKTGPGRLDKTYFLCGAWSGVALGIIVLICERWSCN